MTIAVLALQGAFIEHKKKIERLGADCFEIRKKEDLNRPFDGLILPGGESTVQGKLLRELNLLNELRDNIQNGLPVLGTCAGMILLAEHLTGDGTVHFGTLPVTVKRNAYGRQLGSFYTEAPFKGIGTIPMTFIRAPYVEKAEHDVEILSVVKNRITAVKYKNQIALAFHPELNDNLLIHRMFLDLVS